MVWAGGRIRANMSCDDHVAWKRIALRLHAGDLERDGDRRDSPIAVGNEADALGPRTEAAEAADDSQGTRVPAPQAPVRACNDDLDKVGLALGAADFLDRYAGAGIRRQKLHDRLSRCAGTVECLEDFQCLFKGHGSGQSTGVI